MNTNILFVGVCIVAYILIISYIKSDFLRNFTNTFGGSSPSGNDDVYNEDTKNLVKLTTITFIIMVTFCVIVNSSGNNPQNNHYHNDSCNCNRTNILNSKTTATFNVESK